jgi:hypothetical protein
MLKRLLSIYQKWADGLAAPTASDQDFFWESSKISPGNFESRQKYDALSDDATEDHVGFQMFAITSVRTRECTYVFQLSSLWCEYW